MHYSIQKDSGHILCGNAMVLLQWFEWLNTKCVIYSDMPYKNKHNVWLSTNKFSEVLYRKKCIYSVFFHAGCHISLMSGSRTRSSQQ